MNDKAVEIDLKTDLKVIIVYIFNEIINEISDEVDLDKKVAFDKNVNEANVI